MSHYSNCNRPHTHSLTRTNLFRKKNTFSMYNVKNSVLCCIIYKDYPAQNVFLNRIDRKWREKTSLFSLLLPFSFVFGRIMERRSNRAKKNKKKMKKKTFAKNFILHAWKWKTHLNTHNQSLSCVRGWKYTTSLCINFFLCRFTAPNTESNSIRLVKVFLKRNQQRHTNSN